MFQVKVEYAPEKFINFMVDVVSVYCGSYTFENLIDDIKGRCPNLGHLSSSNMRIRYQDDEGSFINLEFGDENGFKDMWDNAKPVPDRDYKRIKVKASEINSPCVHILKSLECADQPSVSSLRHENPAPSRRGLNFSSEPSKCDPFSDQNQFQNMNTVQHTVSSKDSFEDHSYQYQTINRPVQPASDRVSTPLERLFNNLENDIAKNIQELEAKKQEVQEMEREINAALQTHSNVPVCSQCHLREGHTKRNCHLGQCSSAKVCGMIERHPEEKGRKRKLETEIAQHENEVRKLQDNYKRKKLAYSKVSKSFSSRIEEDLIESNPSVYIVNGCKNWSLINKHAAILEQKCNGKLPKRSDIQKLLSGKNPKKETLENHGIVFPAHSNLSASRSYPSFKTYRSTQEEEDYNFAKTLQSAEIESRYGSFDSQITGISNHSTDHDSKQVQKSSVSTTSTSNLASDKDSKVTKSSVKAAEEPRTSLALLAHIAEQRLS